MRKIFITIIFLFGLQPLSVIALENMWTISADEWSRPRTGYSLSQMKPLQASINQLNKTPGSILVVQYPGGEEGVLWVSELKDWLVSMGIPSKRIQMRAGQANHETITIMLQ